MMIKKAKFHSIVASVAALISATGQLACDQQEDSTQVVAIDPEIETPSIDCGEVQYADPATGDTTTFPEVYYPKAIAKGLAAYGEVVDASGLSCDQARAAVNRLGELRVAYPGAEESEAEVDEVGAPASEDVEEETELRIWAGRFASNYHTPVVLLGFTPKGGGSVPFRCTGSIISERHVLTSAHCAPKAGTQTIEWSSVAGGSVAKFSAKVHIHPSFTGGVQSAPLKPENDYALIEMPVRDETSIMESSSNRFRIYTGNTIVGQKLRIRGYGLRSEAADSFPEQHLPQRPYNDEMLPVSTHSGNVFQARSTTRARTCVGDSGGPAIEKGTYNSPILWGVFSGFESTAGHKYCPDSGKRLYWAKTNAARTWIQDKMKETFGSSFTCKVYGDAGKTYRRCW